MLSYNIAPTQQVPVIRRENPLVLQDMRWGFIPFFTKSLEGARTPINARDDSLQKNMYKHSLKKQRCIIPADGFFEWKKYGTSKHPYFICNEDKSLLSFGGIYSKWSSGAEEIYSFAIITTEPNEYMKPIHNRMPMILEPNNVDTWLKTDIGLEDIRSLIRPFEGELMSYPVSPYVNSPKNDSSKCIEPISTSSIGKEKGQRGLEDYF